MAWKILNSVENLGLSDIQTVGPHHTWWNPQDNNIITRKLDRAMGNATWLTDFPLSLAEFGPRGLSDHSPIILHTNLSQQRASKPSVFQPPDGH